MRGCSLWTTQQYGFGDKLDKRIKIGLSIATISLFLVILWQLGILGYDLRTCDPDPSGFGGFGWSEMLVDTDGTFYIKVVDLPGHPMTFTNITIKSRKPGNIDYIVETPSLPFVVTNQREFLIAGRYEPVTGIKEGEKCWFHVDMFFTKSVAGTTIEHKESAIMSGRFGIVELPEPC